METERRAQSFLIATVSTIVVSALAVVMVRYIAERAAENLGRLAAGESDWERHHTRG